MVRHIFIGMVVAFMLLPLATLFGQTPEHLRPDSVLLSVYNTGNLYRLTPASFAPRTPREELLTDMVWVSDTTVRFEDSGITATLPEQLLSKMPDSLRQKYTSQKLMQMVTNRKCDKAINPSEVKDKVVIMELGTCDASQKALMAQRAGAKAIILVHNNNLPTNIQVTWGHYQDSIKIPCYTVRKDIGKRISAMLPSKVGIKRPDTMPVNAEALTSRVNNDSIARNQQNKSNGDDALDTDFVLTETSQAANGATNNPSSSPKTVLTNRGRYNWRISPNPTSDYTTVEYRFSQPTDVTIEVFNKLGQVLSRTNYKAAQSGALDIDVANWASGVYTIHLTPKDNKPTVKKLVVTH